MSIEFNPNTKNNDIGLYWKSSRRVDPAGAGLPYILPEFATGIKAATGGLIVVKNTNNDVASVLSVESGEWQPIVYNEVLASATIDGQLETTTATGLFWTTSPGNLIDKR